MQDDYQQKGTGHPWAERSFVYIVVVLCIINYVYEMFRIFTA